MNVIRIPKREKRIIARSLEWAQISSADRNDSVIWLPIKRVLIFRVQIIIIMKRMTFMLSPPWKLIAFIADGYFLKHRALSLFQLVCA